MNERLYNDILKTKNYRFICDSLIKRIIKEESIKYKKYNDQLQAIKTKLHIIYGAFINNKSYDEAYKLIENISDITEILKLHISTSERLHNYKVFYDFIFSNVNNVTKVIDLGCGFNPFTINLQSSITSYYAYDIDKRNSELLNHFFKVNNFNGLAEPLDLITNTPEVVADIAYMFKIVPVIESQKKGRVLEILAALKVKYIVITFPITSLTGKDHGMQKNYTEQFYRLIGDKYPVVANKALDNEIIFIIEKK